MAKTARSLTLAFAGAAVLATGAASFTLVDSIAAQPRRQRGERFDIRFHRPDVVGRRVQVSLTATKHQVVEAQLPSGWQTVSTEDAHVTFEGVARTVSLGVGGSPLSTEYTVSRFVSEADATVTSIPAGTVVTLVRATSHDAEPTWTVGGRPLGDDVVAALSVAFNGHVSDGHEEEIFGSATPRRVGERWSIVDAVAETTLQAEANITADLTGDVLFESLENVDGARCMVLVGSMDGDIRAFPDMPPGATLTRGTMTARHRGTLPVDPAEHPRREAMDMHFAVELGLAPEPGAPSAVRVTVDNHREESSSPVR